MELNALQVFMLGLAVMVITALVNWLAEKRGVHIGREWLTAILFALSLGFAAIWQPVALPAFPAYGGDPAVFSKALIEYAGALAAVAATLTGFATVIYNWIGKRVYEKLPQ